MTAITRCIESHYGAYKVGTFCYPLLCGDVTVESVGRVINGEVSDLTPGHFVVT